MYPAIINFGVIAAGIGNISNQNNEKLITGSKIHFGDTIFVKAQSNAQILLLDETALTWVLIQN